MTIPLQETVRDTDLAYLAGLIDGEGSIGIERKPAYGKYRSPRYTLKVDIQMSDRPAIDHVARLFQRTVMIKKPSQNMRKAAYRVCWQSRIAAALLEQLLPHLVLKRPQAAVAIQFQQVMAVPRGAARLLTGTEVETRDAYYRELRRLKRES